MGFVVNEEININVGCDFNSVIFGIVNLCIV